MGQLLPPQPVRWTIDSIEEDVAAVEDERGRVLHVPLALLPDGVHEGDVLAVERRAGRDGALTLRIARDPAATDRAWRASERQLRRKPGPRARKDPGGDVEL